jgi:hypothetical protein
MSSNTIVGSAATLASFDTSSSALRYRSKCVILRL